MNRSLPVHASRRHRHGLLLLCYFLFASATFAYASENVDEPRAAAIAPAAYALPEDARAQIGAEIGIRTFVAQDLVLPVIAEAADAPEALAATVLLADRATTLLLAKHEMRTPNAVIMIDHGGGVMETRPMPAAATYRGAVQDDPTLQVTATLGPRGLSATIRGGADTWHLQPASAETGLPDGTHLTYAARDLQPVAGSCGADQPVNNIAAPALPNGAPAPPVGNRENFQSNNNGANGSTELGSGIHMAQIAFDVDVEYYQGRGSSLQEVVDAAAGHLNSVAAIYETDVDITYRISTIIIRTAEPDPYGSFEAETLLDQLQDHWQANHLDIEAEHAHLLTGKNLNGSTIGFARGSNGYCNTKRYGLSQLDYNSSFSRRVALLAHELGHNWGACHCDQSDCTGGGSDGDCGIMCHIIGGCAETNSFGNRSQNSIGGTRDGAACLDAPDCSRRSYAVPGQFNTIPLAVNRFHICPADVFPQAGTHTGITILTPDPGSSSVTVRALTGSVLLRN